MQVDAAGNSDRTVVSNTATINGGEVIVQPAHQVYGIHTIYTILTATNGVFGTLYTDSIITNASFFPSWLGFASSLQYDAHNVYLTLSRNPFVSVANTYNQHSVAGALDGIGMVGLSGTMSNLVSEFFWLPRCRHSAGSAGQHER